MKKINNKAFASLCFAGPLIGGLLGSPVHAGELIEPYRNLQAVSANQNGFVSAEGIPLENPSVMTSCNDNSVVATSHNLTDDMLNWQEHVTDKTMLLLRARQDGELCDRKLTLGTMFKASFMAEWAQKPGKFSILSRFPGGSEGTSLSRFVINNAAFSTTVTPTDWLTGYAQFEYTEIEFPNQDPLQLRKAFAVIGDLNRFPVYGFIGRKTIDWGNFETYSPFTHSVGNHFWRADSDGPVAGLGVDWNGFNAVATAINGGRQLRTADTPTTGQVNNFAVKASKTFAVGSGTSVTVGGGYLHGTIYNSTLAHHPFNNALAADKERTGALNGFVTLNNPHFDFNAEYTTLDGDWLATGAAVESLDIQGRYKTSIRNYLTAFTLSYGLGIVGPSGTSFEKLEQYMAGMEVNFTPNISMGLEYVHNNGFLPLIDIQNVADKDADSDSIILGLRMTY